MDYISKHPIKRYIDGNFQEEMDDILIEYILSIHIDGRLMVKLSCIPEELEELTIGYLYSESIISSIADIKEMELDVEKGYANVILNISKSQIKREITTDSGDFLEIPYSFKNTEEGIFLNKISWEPEVVLANANLLLAKSESFKKTGNVHSSMLCIGDKILYFSEDVARFNALDKTIGKALKKDVDFSQTCIYTSGRVPSGICLKVIRCGIPMVVSRSAPTVATLNLAKKHNLTVIGFAKGSKMNLY